MNQSDTLSKARLTIKSFMSGGKDASQLVTHFINQIFKVLFALLSKCVLHFLGTTCVSLRTYTKMLTCEINKRHKMFISNHDYRQS